MDQNREKLPKTPAEAKAAGSKTYFTGNPCPYGHVSERYTIGSRCVICALKHSKDQKRLPYNSKMYNPTKKADYYRKNKDRILQQRKSKKAETLGISVLELDRLKLERIEYLKRRGGKRTKEQAEKYYRRDYSMNKDRYLASSAAAKRQRRQQTPPWAKFSEIRIFYMTAARLTEETGIEHHVDHIVPLGGELVSGLHCQFNLQVLPAEQNLRKGNSFYIDSYVHDLP